MHPHFAILSALSFRISVLYLLAACLAVTSISCSKEEGGPTYSEGPGTQYAIDQQAAWSPDGSKIVYTRDPASIERDTAWDWGAYIYFVDTGNDSCLWPNILFDGFAWSPDGNKLAFVTRAQVYIYDFDTDSLVQITHENRNFSVTWSPCGDKIAFFYKSQRGGLYIYDIAADSIIHVSGRNGANAGEWMSDCETLALIDSCRTSDGGIFTYNVPKDSLYEVTRIPGYKREISVSPLGDAIVFGIHRDLWGVSIAGGQPHQLTTNGGAYPDWSPDGNWIVYTQMNPNNGHLWLMRPDGSEKHQITF